MAAMRGGEVLKRIATAMGLLKRPSATSVCYTNSVHGPYPSLNCSFPGHREVIVACPPDRSVKPPIPMYQSVPIDVAYWNLGYSVYPVNEKSVLSTWLAWMCIQLMFGEVLGLDYGGRQFSGYMTYLWLFDIVRLHVVFIDVDGNGNGNGNAVNYADAHVVKDEVGLATWLFGGSVANESGDDLIKQQEEPYSIFCYLFLPLLGIVLFLLHGHSVISAIIQIALGNWIFGVLPLWSRLVVFIFSLIFFIPDGMMLHIAHFVWDQFTGYVRNKVVGFYSSIVNPPVPSRSQSTSSFLRDLIQSLRIVTDDIVTSLVQLLPPHVSESLHMASVTYALKVLVACHILLGLLFLCTLL